MQKMQMHSGSILKIILVTDTKKEITGDGVVDEAVSLATIKNLL